MPVIHRRADLINKICKELIQNSSLSHSIYRLVNKMDLEKWWREDYSRLLYILRTLCVNSYSINFYVQEALKIREPQQYISYLYFPHILYKLIYSIDSDTPNEYLGRFIGDDSFIVSESPPMNSKDIFNFSPNWQVVNPFNGQFVVYGNGKNVPEVKGILLFVKYQGQEKFFSYLPWEKNPLRLNYKDRAILSEDFSQCLELFRKES